MPGKHSIWCPVLYVSLTNLILIIICEVGTSIIFILKTQKLSTKRTSNSPKEACDGAWQVGFELGLGLESEVLATTTLVQISYLPVY